MLEPDKSIARAKHTSHALDQIGELNVGDGKFEQQALQLIADSLENSEWADYLSSATTLNSITGFMAIAMTCRTHECPYANKCPIMAHLQTLPKAEEEEYIEELSGKPCRLDRVEAAKELITRCREYGINPTSTTDLGHVMTIVQLQQLRRKIIWELNDYGMMIDTPAFEVKTQGKVAYRKEVNPLLNSLAVIDSQIQKTESILQVTRKDKAQFMSNNADAIIKASAVLKQRQRISKSTNNDEEVVDL